MAETVPTGGKAVPRMATSTDDPVGDVPVELAGRVQTVLGTIDPGQMGITLPHEHVFVDTTALLEPPAEATDRARSHMPFTLENLGWIRYNYFRHHDNVRLDDEETAVSEVELFRRSGGATIVDVTGIVIYFTVAAFILKTTLLAK